MECLKSVFLKEKEMCVLGGWEVCASNIRIGKVTFFTLSTNFEI